MATNKPDPVGYLVTLDGEAGDIYKTFRAAEAFIIRARHHSGGNVSGNAWPIKQMIDDHNEMEGLRIAGIVNPAKVLELAGKTLVDIMQRFCERVQKKDRSDYDVEMLETVANTLAALGGAK